jgi:ribosomal protein S18 acetylase RimI-like enzyme
LKELFASVGWESANDADNLVKALKKSSHVISVWDGNKLVGLIRSMDDGCWSANIDCLVVHKKYQNRGIAKQLLSEMLDDLKKIKYINVCPDHKDVLALYINMGFKIVNGYFLQKQN